MKRRDVLLAISLANVLLLEPWSRVLFVEPYYLGRPRIRADYLGVMLAVLLLAGLMMGLAHVARRARSERPRQVARALAVLSLAVPAFALARAHFEDQGLEHGLAWARARPGIAAAIGAGIVAVTALAVRFRRFAWVGVRVLLLIMLPFALVTFGQSIAGVFRSPSSAPAGPGPCPRQRAEAAARGPRVVWVILDELDQRVAFEQRPGGLAMPALDRLRGEALVANRAYPPGPETMISVPALTTGELVSEVFIGEADALRMQRFNCEIERWRPEATVFGRVKAMGLHARLAGWAHSYCHVLGAGLDSCVAAPSYYVVTGELQGGSVIASAAEQLLALAPWGTRRLHAHAYERVLDEARAAAAHGDAGLVFVHLPVPHLPAVYSRTRGKMSWWNFQEVHGYLDNLVLADRALGALREAMEEAGVWQETGMIVSADHAWRDAASYDGVVDRRVPFVVKLPGQGPGQGRVYEGTFDTVVTQALVLAMLSGEVSSMDALERWLDAHRSAAPRPEVVGNTCARPTLDSTRPP